MRPEELLRRAGLSVAGRPRRLSGGDMGQVWQIGPFVVKSHPSPPRGLYPAEARGLAQLGAAGCRVPAVHYVDEDGLIIDDLGSGPADWGDLAAQLAHLHGAPAPPYGAPAPVFLGRFELPAGTGTDWRALWWELRLRPLVQATRGTLGGAADRVEQAALRGPISSEGPVLLHGDLWSGNLHMGRAGAALIDPSVWCGERGVDLAMMQLFGGFPRPFWRAYEAALPIPESTRTALPLYRLYYLLVHVHFFGAGYLSGVRGALDELEV